MPDSQTLLAEPTSNGDRRTPVLLSKDRQVQVRAHLESIDESPVLILRTYDEEAKAYTYVAIDEWAQLLDIQRSLLHSMTMEQLKKALHRRGLDLDPRPHERWLLADHGEGSRRTAVLSDDDSEVAVRAKQVTDDEWALLHLRAYLPEVGWVHIGLDEDSSLAALATGQTDKDAFARFRGELERRGYELDYDDAGPASRSTGRRVLLCRLVFRRLFLGGHLAAPILTLSLVSRAISRAVFYAAPAMLAMLGPAALPDEETAAGFVRATAVGGPFGDVVEEFQGEDRVERKVLARTMQRHLLLGLV